MKLIIDIFMVLIIITTREATGVITNTNLGEIRSTVHDQLSGWAAQVTVKAEDVHEGSSLSCTRLGNQSSCLFVCYEEATCILD